MFQIWSKDAGVGKVQLQLNSRTFADRTNSHALFIYALRADDQLHRRIGLANKV